jgi:uncharacterized repeat protein (TIGR01451 family)
LFDWLNGLMFASFLFASSAANAAVTVNKTFSPSSMTVGGTSTITITLGNTGTIAATGTAFTDNLPGGLIVASPSNVATTCGGTASATSGGSTISLGGGTIAASGGSCTVTAAVTTNTLGNYTNTIPAGGVTSSEGSNGSAASATLAVIATQPITGTWAKTYPPGFGGNLKGNGPAITYTVTLNNQNTLALTNVGLTFSLPMPTVAFATPANLTTTCGGTVTPNTTVGTGTLSGGTIPANGNCTIAFDVIAAQPNIYYYATPLIVLAVGAITDDQGITNSTTINAGVGVQTGSRVDKSFLPTSIISGGTSTLTLTIHNLNYSTLSPINLTDTLPSVAAGAMIVAPTPNASTTCGGTLTATAGSGSVQLSGGSLPSVPQNASTSVTCTIIVDVVGTNSGTTGINLTNSIPTGNFGGVNYPAVATNLTVTPNQPLYGSRKAIANEYYAGALVGTPGTVHAMTITLTNPASSPVTVTSLSDDLTTMGSGFTVATSPSPSTTCAGGTVNAPAGGTLITMSGGTVPAGDGTTSGTCTVTAGIYVPMLPTALGNHYNTIPAGNIVTSAGSNVTAITYGVGFVTPVAIGKSFNPAAVNPGGRSTLTISLSRNVRLNETAVDGLTNISDTDTLPAGIVIDTPSGWSTTCTGATITAPDGGSAISFSGVNLNPAQSCAITLNVRVPLGTPTGVLQNLIPANSVTTNQGFTNSSRPVGGGSWGNGSAAANMTVASATVTINKAFTPATVAVGTASQLAINFVNTNPGNIQLTQAALTDTLPPGMTIASPVGASFTGAGCAGTVAATVGASSVGVSNATINAGATCTLKVNVVGTAAGNLINSIPANALTSVQNVTNSAPTTATLAVSGTANLGITKTDGVTQIATGTTRAYTVVVSNAGPNNVIGATVTDTPPSGMTFTNWTCASSAGASCGTASGTGPINETININTGATVTYTVQALVAANYSGGSITNSATVTQPPLVTDPNTANNTATDTDTVVPGVVLALTKTDGSTTYTPGGTATYTVTVKNSGAANATQLNVNDALPAGVTLAGNVSCTPAGTATCGTVTGSAGQTSFSATNATIPTGASNQLTFTAPVAFASSLTTSPLVNTVSATDAASGATGSASDSDTANASADVSIVKTGTASVVPGGTISYTLTIANAGPSAANGATFNDAVPVSIAGITASCGSASGGAVCPGSVSVAGNTVSGAIPTLPPGGSVVVTINGTTSASTSAPIANTATVAASAGVTDPANANNSSTWTTALKPTVSIDKTVNATTVIPGDTVIYTITVTNTGPIAANGTLVTDPIPNGITAQTWACAASGGAVCPTPSGSGALSQTLATFPPGSSVVYTVTATVSLTPPTNINNTATATPPNGACSPTNTPAPCSDTASLPPVPQIGLSKTADTSTVTPGGTIHYTIVVSNTGVPSADNTPVSDPIPAGIASQTWTCVASGGATCTTPNGSGAISDTILAFPAGSFVTYTVTAIVDAAPPAIVSNTVTATPQDPSAVCTPGNTAGPCTVTANVTSNAQISITKTANTSALTPGGSVTYTITVTNTGPVAADGTTVSDPIPSGITTQTWTCAANAGASCTGSGSGAISDTLASFPPGSFVTYTIVATIADNPPETITNIVTANPPSGGICTPGNTPPPCDAEVSGGAVPQISVTKTSDATGAVTPGGIVTYTVNVTNVGSADAANTLVSDSLPAGIASATWTCAANGGAVCPNASGSGAINETLATFPSGGSVAYTIVATVSATPPASVNNTVSVMPPSGVCLPGNTAPPCTATVSNASAAQISVTKTADDPTYTAGGTLSWTVTVTNTGSAAADGTTVSDPLPAGIISSAWTCLPSGGAICANANGNDAIAESIPTFPSGGSVTYLISGTVVTPAPITITNTAAATPPAGGTCAPANAAPPCMGTVSTPSAQSVTTTKSVVDANGNGIADPGEQLTYTIVLTNSGGSDATGFGVSDPLDANTAFVSASNGGTLVGNIVTWSGLTVPAGGNVALTLVVTVASPLPAGVTHIANVAYETGTTAPSCPPAGPACVVLPTPGSVTIAKSVIEANGNGIAEPGESLSYTILLTNAGGSDITGYGVTDPLDANVVFIVADNGGTETGGVVTWANLTVPAGGTLALSVVATVVDPLPSGVMQIANVAYETGTTAPACPPAGPQCVVLPTPGAVTIAKSVADANGNSLAEPGETLTYTITLTNTGAVDHSNYSVTDPLDPNVVFVSADNGGIVAGGTVTWTGLTVPANSSLSLTVVVNVADPIPSGVVEIGNLAYETGGTPPNCAVTPRPMNCTVIPTQTPGTITITKSVEDGTHGGTAQPGEPLTYTITLTNTNGGDVTGYGLTDPLDPNVVFTSADNGGTFAGGTVTWTNLTIPANSSLALTVLVTVVDPIPPGVTAIGNFAYATGSSPPICTAVPMPPNCTSIPVSAGAVSITKSVADASGNNMAEPGETLTYTITLSNTGGGDFTNYGLTDPLDPNVAFVSATNGGAFAGGTVTWSGLTVPANGSLTLTVVVTVANPIPPGVTAIGNFAYATGSTPPVCTAVPMPSNCASIPVRSGAVSIAKTVADASGNNLAEPGETLTYAITLSNTGGGDVTNYGVTDPLDPNVAFVSADNGGAFAGGTVTWSGLTVPANGSLTLTVVATVADPIPNGVTAIRNVAYPTGATPADCMAAPVPPSCAVITTSPPSGTAELLIQKSVNTSSTTPGGTLVYTVAVSNVGTAPATNAVLSDPMPSGIASYAWTCAASGGAVCPNANGSGAIAETIATLPASGAVVYTITAVLSTNPPSNITNIADVTSSSASTCASSGSPPPCSSEVTVNVTPNGGQNVVPTPVNSRWMLLLMTMVLMGAAAYARRKI